MTVALLTIVSPFLRRAVYIPSMLKRKGILRTDKCEKDAGQPVTVAKGKSSFPECSLRQWHSAGALPSRLLASRCTELQY